MAESGSQGKPLSTQVRVHSITTQTPASPSTANTRRAQGRPPSRGIAQRTAANQTPVQTPMKGPSKNNPAQVTLCNHARMIVHATACAPTVAARNKRQRGARYAQ